MRMLHAAEAVAATVQVGEEHVTLVPLEEVGQDDGGARDRGHSVWASSACTSLQAGYHTLPVSLGR